LDIQLIEEASLNIYYKNFLSDKILSTLIDSSRDVEGVCGLKHLGSISGIENSQSLSFVKALYVAVEAKLNKLLIQRYLDRKFIDERTASCSVYNADFNLNPTDEGYQTVLGMTDEKNRVVWGPKSKNYFIAQGANVADLPDYLKGNHVTLFGPPDSAKLAINAMNCFHRKLPNEAPIIKSLLASSECIPKWGADDEDSKTPIRSDLMDAAQNLKQCFDGTLTFEDKKKYVLETEKLALPIKRFPGLALPCTFLFYEDRPIPLHLYDFALHLFEHAQNPKALTFYVPKIENEEEAAYLKFMVATAEKLIMQSNPHYELGSVKLILVLENPRALFRVNEIMDELHPYFAGASLGWHDFLASTARCFKEDPNYRIPVKADPDIVIKYIKASHELLANVVGGRGGIKIGGMYGVLPTSNDLQDASFQLTLKGYFKDVITQLKRGLDGFWVAHPDFVRIGIALVEAWKKYKSADVQSLESLVNSLFNSTYQKEVMDFICGSDIPSLPQSHPLFERSLLAAVATESQVIANNHPEEIRYNVFQSLQYLADWLSGNGCVALPAHINDIPVRVMDDLATAERSRWEVWHEIKNKRFDKYEFLKIAHEELMFIRKNLSSDKKIVQVKFDNRTAKWYPVAFKLMLKLMTDDQPVEFATELLLAFTCPMLRHATDPWQAALELDAKKYSLESNIIRFNYYFEMCGSLEFAKTQSINVVVDLVQIEKLIMAFTQNEVIEAARFHGDIGGSKVGLDAMANAEQAKLKDNSELRISAQNYLDKFGFKFLVSAKDKTDIELLAILNQRINNSLGVELANAKAALFEITKKRIVAHPLNNLKQKIDTLMLDYKIEAAQVCIINPQGIQQLNLGKCDDQTHFQIASLSKTLASYLALDYFSKHKIPLTTKVNQLLASARSSYRIPQGDDVEILHLMNHTALNLHYVNGVPIGDVMPPITDFLKGNSKYGYESVAVKASKVGLTFNYSGGGFLVLEHLLEALSGVDAKTLMQQFLKANSIDQLEFNQMNRSIKHANGFDDAGDMISGGRKMFPAFAAGASGTANAVAQFLKNLEFAYHDINGSKAITHEVACSLFESYDFGSKEFMGAKMGAGVFVVEAEDNSFALHQGANDGFRAIFLHCYSGPDRGKGIVIFSNSELRGVLFNAAVVQLILSELNISGIDTLKFNKDFNPKNISAEKIVNLGYKKLIFDAFKSRLPEEIIQKGKLDPLAKYNLIIGAKILSVTNERFARAENLISPHEPIFDPTLFGKEGKIMDSWETPRHNQNSADTLTLKLTKPSSINYIKLSTKYHFGNHAPKVSINYLKHEKWLKLLPMVTMEGHSEFSIKLKTTITDVQDVQIKILPDGGLSRVSFFEVLPAETESEFKVLDIAKPVVCLDKIPQTQKPMNIAFNLSQNQKELHISKLKMGDEFNAASAYFGAKILSASNEHYSPASTMLSPYGPIHMFDGLESARSRTIGHFDQVIIQLSHAAKIHRYEFDFTYFVNNNPREISLLGFDGSQWHIVLDKYSVKRFAGNKFQFKCEPKLFFEQIKIQTWPDGGLNRFKAYTLFNIDNCKGLT
jgi:malate synthase